MVVPPAHRTSGTAASPNCSIPSVTPFASTVVITPRRRDAAAGTYGTSESSDAS
jgi:hypothetical protein